MPAALITLPHFCVSAAWKRASSSGDVVQASEPLMVRAGLGISIVPALTLYQFRAPELAIVPLSWPGLRRRIYLVRRRDRGLSVAAQAFCDWVLARRPGAGTPIGHTKR